MHCGLRQAMVDLGELLIDESGRPELGATVHPCGMLLRSLVTVVGSAAHELQSQVRL